VSELARFRRFFELLGYEFEPFQELIAAEVFSERRECLCLLPRATGSQRSSPQSASGPY
jgi:hypothetical protein